MTPTPSGPMSPHDERGAASTPPDPVPAPARRAALAPGASAPPADALPRDVGENAPQNEVFEAGDVAVCKTLCKPQPDSVPPSAEGAASGRDRRGRFVAANTLGVETRFQPGNELQLVHGLRRRNALEAQPAIAAHLAERRDRVVADLGGDVSFVKARLAVSFARVDLLLDDLFERTVAQGIFTSRGRVRACFDRLLPLIDRHLRLAQALGLERVAKDALTLDHYLKSRYGTATLTQDAPTPRAEAQAEGADDLASQAAVAAQAETEDDDGGAA